MSMFLIVMDTYSNCMYVHTMKSITSTSTIDKLRIVFANFGFPRKVVTDNGSSFISEEFYSFMSQNAIVYVTTCPSHPSSNGLSNYKNRLKHTFGGTHQE